MDTTELDKRINKGVRNVTISRLLESGKIYDINTYQEDENGTLAPDHTHCWLNWESRFIDPEDNAEHWIRQAFDFSSLEKAEEAKVYLEEHLVK